MSPLPKSFYRVLGSILLLVATSSIYASQRKPAGLGTDYAAENLARKTPLPADGLYNNAEGSPVIELVNAAQDRIDVEIYTMDDLAFRVSIRNALSRKIKVRILKDPSPVGATCNPFNPSGSASADCLDQQKLVSDVNQAGGSFTPFNKAELCATPGANCFEHGKIVIADAKVALISTGNFDQTNLCDASAGANPSKCDRDFSVITSDASQVGLLNDIFAHDILGTRYDLAGLLAQHAVSSITVSPFSLDPLVAFINSAQTSIQVENQYLEEKNINQALRSAAERGVKVDVMVASFCAFGKPKAPKAKLDTSIFAAFDGAKIATKLFTKAEQIDGHPGYLHAKAMVVDGKRAWIGSVNGSMTSVSQNREYGIFLDDAAAVNKLAAVLSGDFANPAAETWQDSLNCANDR